MAGHVVGSRKGCPLLLLARLLLQVVVSSASGLSLSSSAIVSFDPPVLHDVVEAGNRSVVVSIAVPGQQLDAEPPGTWNMSWRSLHPDVATSDDQIQLDKSSFAYDNASKYYTMDTTITIHGRNLGKTGLKMRLVRADSWNEDDDWWKEGEAPRPSSSVLDVWVRRHPDSEKLTKYFVVSVVLLIIAGNIMMGCEIDVDVVLQTIRRPVAPAIGFIAQFLIMPLLAFAIAQTVFVPRGLYSMALGLFITGCSPGGGASNFWTLLLDGNVNLSVTMTFISTLASLVMMPFWISLLGVNFLQGFSSNTKIHVPYANITRSLASLVLPLLIGVAIQKWKPLWAAKSKKIMRPFIIFVLIFVVVFGAITNFYMFRQMTWPALFGGLLLPWCGFMFGCFTSIILRRSPADVTAIAIETGIQNTGIAILLLKASFSQPDADIGAVLPVIVACFTPAPLLMGAAVHMTVKAIRKRRQSSVDTVEKQAATISLEMTRDTPSCALLVDPSKLESRAEVNLAVA